MKQGEINQDKNVCHVLYIPLTVNVHPCQFESHMFMITIEDLLRILEYMYFDDKNNFHEEFSFRLYKSSFYSFIFCFFCTESKKTKRIEREKIVEIFSAILNLATWASKSNLFQVL